MKYLKYLLLMLPVAAVCLVAASDAEAAERDAPCSVYQRAIEFNNTLPETIASLPEQLKIENKSFCIFEKVKIVTILYKTAFFNFINELNITFLGTNPSEFFSLETYIFQLSTQLE